MQLTRKIETPEPDGDDNRAFRLVSPDAGRDNRPVRLFEPLLMAVIGVVIGLIVVLMYFPIFELAGSLQ